MGRVGIVGKELDKGFKVTGEDLGMNLLTVRSLIWDGMVWYGLV